MQRYWKSVTGYYHVAARGTGKQIIFENDDDRWDFLNLLKSCSKEKGVTVIAWCLMSNYVHLVLADFDDQMSSMLQKLLTNYARRFNKRTGRSGHLFQNRFDRRSLDTDAHLLAAIRYVHANPQNAGMCMLQYYRWSSYREYLRMFDGEPPLGFSDPTIVGSLWSGKADFISFSSKLPGDDPAIIHPTDETEIERYEAAERLVFSLGYSLDMLKTLPPADRNKALFVLNDAEYSTREVERYTGISRSTVSRVVRAYVDVKSKAEELTLARDKP